MTKKTAHIYIFNNRNCRAGRCARIRTNDFRITAEEACHVHCSLYTHNDILTPPLLSTVYTWRALTILGKDDAAGDDSRVPVIPPDDVDRVCEEVTALVAYRCGHHRVLRDRGEVHVETCDALITILTEIHNARGVVSGSAH